MRIVETYSHLNGEEYLIVHRKLLHREIRQVIGNIDAGVLRTKISREITMRGRRLYSPKALNAGFKKRFRRSGWGESRYAYYVTTNYDVLQRIMPLDLTSQRTELAKLGTTNFIRSYKQTDFVKEKVAVEVQFGKYAFVAFDLFVKHMLFYGGGLINVGVEVLPMKSMQEAMSSGIAYFEGEVYNVLRHGRSHPAVPLWIVGVAP